MQYMFVWLYTQCSIKCIVFIFCRILPKLYGLLLPCSTSRDQEAFCIFINAVRADDKGDSAEDIIGGIQASISRGDEDTVKVTKV